ncbi:MAG: glycosyl transferase family 2, partial [Muribaculaceae bacterium]|nr:glycosyl transferase family 2 [Muribaculaceae bacterium]
DIDMSTRIRQAGFGIGLLREVPVWHKRRGNLRKFFRQVYVFGMSRITLHLLYPGSLKAVHTFPALFVLGCVALVLLGIFCSPWWLLPLGVWLAAIFAAALVQSGSPAVALKAVPASCIQLWGYGLGFLRAFFTKILLRRGRDIDEEIRLRKGK